MSERCAGSSPVHVCRRVGDLHCELTPVARARPPSPLDCGAGDDDSLVTARRKTGDPTGARCGAGSADGNGSVEAADAGVAAVAGVAADAAAAVGLVVAGWAAAQEPYLLPPDLTVREAAAPDATLVALLISAALGLALLIPALAWLFRLALSGRLAYEDEPRP
jgi:hypothetical protein